jgi:predicted transcriptional regulator
MRDWNEMWQPEGRRSEIEIIADILRLIRLGDTGTTEIIYTAKINREQTSRYLQKLLEADLLEEAQEEIGMPAYRITRKGLTLLSQIEAMQEMLPPKDIVDILHRSKIIAPPAAENSAVESTETEEAS